MVFAVIVPFSGRTQVWVLGLYKARTASQLHENADGSWTGRHVSLFHLYMHPCSKLLVLDVMVSCAADCSTS